MSVLSAGLLSAGCAVVDSGPEVASDNDPPLADVDELLAGAPKADELDREFKADENLPSSFADLREFQSPVKSQGSRGVCSIFSTTAYMEHLYIAEGTITDPDFSEQYLQWSAKFQVNSFPNSSGSNANYNLQAINRFGIVSEADWPYETSEWGSSDDEACTGEDDQPTRCYTNGAPPESAMNAPKYRLPSSRYLHPEDIRSHLFNRRIGVVAGMTFFYQSWNHRRSQLPTNSDYWNQGYVLSPNDKDREISLEKRAGHSILLIGWDDDLEVQTVDEEGQPVVDDNGDPVMEKGFYLFKNSWGTSGFGTQNEHGAGYGWISYKYVHEFASVRYAGLPGAGDFSGVEICDDGADNDDNGAVDCADAACAGHASCEGGGGEEHTFTNAEGASIPDNDATGASASINIDETGTIAGVSVDVDITHTYRGDLRVSLHRDGDAVVLHSRAGGAADDLVASFDLEDYNGSDMRGEWQLVVVDSAAIDTGRLNSWTLRIRTE